MSKSFNSAYKITINSARLFVTLLFIHILELSIAQSQRITPYFSTISEIPLYRGNQNLIIGDFNGDGYQDIGSYGNGVIAIFYNFDELNNYSIKYFETESKNFKAVVGDINSDNIDDIIYLDSDKKFIRTYLGADKDTIISKWKFKLDDIYTKIKLEDINNDKKKDIILYGKKNLGLTILLGKGDGTFKYPKVIFDEYFFSEIQICNCSEDNIPDIFAVNWIENKILYFTSYAPLKYLSPAIYSFSSEPIVIDNFQLNDDEIIDLLVLLEDGSTVLTFLGDNLGNYSLNDKITLDYKIDKYLISNLNHNLSNKLILLNKPKHFFSVLGKDNSQKYREEFVYSTISEFSDFKLYDANNSGLYDLIGVSENDKKIYILQNALKPETNISELKYVSMPQPGTLFTIDLNNDKNLDLILSSNDDYSTACYLNQGNRHFSGMISLKGFPKNINNLFLVNYTENELQFLTTQEVMPTIYLVSFDLKDYSTDYYPVSGVAKPKIFPVKMLNHEKNSGLDFIVSSYQENSKGLEVFHYRQINKYKYSENILNNIEKDIIGFAVCDLDFNSTTDYLYLRRSSKMNLMLGAYIIDSNYNITNNKKYFEFTDTVTTNYHLITKDINNDNFLDLIIYSPQKMELLISLFNISDTAFRKPHQKIENINLGSLNNIQFCDLDNDDRIDLLIGNIYTQTLQVYFNKGDGTFSLPVTLMGIYEISSFVAGDFDSDKYTDIALVYKDGYLKIVYGQQ